MSHYKPSEHDGLKADGTPDKRVSSEHGLGADRERASELGKQGGSTGGRASGGENDSSYEPNSGAEGNDNDGVPLKADGSPDLRTKAGKEAAEQQS